MTGLSEPPEGAIAGDSVPRENEIDEHRRAKLRQTANSLKSHPRFTEWDTEEIIDYLIEKED